MSQKRETKEPFYAELAEANRRLKEERRAKRAEKKYTASEFLAKLRAQSSKRSNREGE
jgi:hypothetical protein